MKRWPFAVLLLVGLCGCMPQRLPSSFSRTMTSGWATIEIREGVDYARAWRTTLGILVRQFDVEFISMDDGYIRTAWTHTWSGAYEPNYRVRVTVKFSDSRGSLDMKTEAHALSGAAWVLGVDSRLLSTLKTDLMGTVGRTAR